MELTLNRRQTVKKTTLGGLSIDGSFFCFTLEDVVREIVGQPVSDWKIQSETAIPAGRYKLELVKSGRFGPDTISLVDVPGFTSVRMHSGNTEVDTDGCIIVGDKLFSEPDTDDGGHVEQSRAALGRLKDVVIPTIKDGKPVYLTITTFPGC
jgi:hypothetical protein